MRNMATNIRLKQIEELEEYIKEKQLLLTGILNTFEWTQESLKDEVKICCPVNSEHWIPETALSKHLEMCKWAKNGYVKEELKKQPPDSNIFYQKSSNVVPVQIDHAVTEKILSDNGLISKDKSYDSSEDFPQTIDRWTVHLNPEQRLAVYNYVVEISKAAEKAKNVTLEDLMIDFEKKDDQEERPKSHLEILAELRDYKRRRQSYRAKNVHITKKSYTEIMKEVIENQTNYLTEVRKFDNNDNANRDYEDSEGYRGKHSGNADNSSDDSSRHKEHHSRHKVEKDDHRKHHHSKHKSSKNYSPKHKKHKNRSRSRSPSRHKHKKSHKHKRSHD